MSCFFFWLSGYPHFMMYKVQSIMHKTMDICRNKLITAPANSLNKQ